jgi:4-diphosphocytidyl-2-C-methyl-D-erythritol kinase
MPQMKVEAPAKLNLHLQIGDRRSDGFHDIESLFAALALGDTLSFETFSKPQALEICMDWQPLEALFAGDFPAIPPEKNIISRAVSLFRSRTGYEEGLKITVEKRIPPGGGLGGGSSDAAATLLALDHLASEGKNPVSDAALTEMGASLGSDVPFFLHAATGAAWVKGKGEQVQSFELPESARNLSVVLVNPGFSSDTAEAYRLFDLWRGKNPPILPKDSAFLLKSLSGPPQNWPFSNDFLTVFKAAAGESPSMSEIFTTYQTIISDLREQGADFAGLSGSGSTCFGVFPGREKAALARENLAVHWPFVVDTFLLARQAI